MAERVLIRGGETERGVYLLHLRVKQPLTVVFGRFQGGKEIPVPVGAYLYLGSAMGAGGSSSLARRVLRHTVRGGGRPSHTIQPALLAAMARVGLGGGGIRPSSTKTRRWHIDYLLAERVVTIAQIYLWRTDQACERPLARMLNQLPCTSPLAPGLGASDDPGSTHLLRLESGCWEEILAAVEGMTE